MINDPSHRIKLIETNWQSHRKELMAIRNHVFIQEQGVPAELEIDEHDEKCQHLLALVDDVPVGCARLLPDGHFGRLAITRPFRTMGLGKQLLEKLEEMALSQGIHKLEAGAQCDALSFYFGTGFCAQTPFFDDAGIPHIHIQKILNPNSDDECRHIQLGLDNNTYPLNSQLELTGFIQSMLSQRPSRIDIQLSDCRAQIWSKDQLISSLSTYLTHSHRHRVRLLLNQDRQILDTPLVQLLTRISSRSDILISEEVQDSEWIFQHRQKPTALITNQNQPSAPNRFKGCPFDPNRASTASKRFERKWLKAKTSTELRRMPL